MDTIVFAVIAAFGLIVGIPIMLVMWKSRPIGKTDNRVSSEDAVRGQIEWFSGGISMIVIIASCALIVWLLSLLNNN